ncbi:MAG: bifunctional hydroxymethylpyrimidine kinase/phosphomethylpyrimidine kinase [Oceanicaulis sp.]
MTDDIELDDSPLTDREDPKGRVLIVAGSDSSGGAGIQADIKTVTALGGYAATAVSAITVQSTEGVKAVHPIPQDILAGQMEAVLTDIGADVIKTGMLGSAETVDTVLKALDAHADPAIPLVVDPVMVAASGDRLVDDTALAAIRDRLAPRAYLLTPNMPEASALTGVEVEDMDGQREAAEILLQRGAKAVLVKGGHMESGDVIDLLATRNGVRLFTRPRIKTRHTHGTGCTLASAISALVAHGLSLDRAVEQGGDYLHEAIKRAPGFGKGSGPVHHGWTMSGGFGHAPVRD